MPPTPRARIRQIDVQLARSSARRIWYDAIGDSRSAAIERGVCDRLLDERNALKRGGVVR